MALPGSGIISMNDIRVELGIPSQAPFNIDDARKGVYVPLNPYSPALPPSSGQVSLASWYSYCHTCTVLYTHTIYRSGNHPVYSNFTSAALACTGTRDYPFTAVSSSSVLGAGSSLYYLSGGTTYLPYIINNPGEELWVWDGTGSKPIRLTNTSSNVIDTVGSCATYYSHWLSYDIGTNLAGLCAGPTYEYFSDAAVLDVGERIYSNAALTTYPPAGYYSDGTNVFYANNVGLLSYEGACGVSPF